MDENPHIRRAIEICDPRGRQRGLAQAIHVSQGLISGWLYGRYPVSAEKAVAIEIATEGRVTRCDLRPDLFGTTQQSNAA